ncbi:hypothetical protein ACFQU2_32470 [Siccirubricoccus deserti]|uniref:Uncharacterized protein n=1 Tax=Siccirubricoccus deserti TaxID=2013562 RepID=A0A9X0QVD2_9PROT|nr:hypothetical protein [Siccirubricoccus deserti]MBC4014641.1 hypothetical protein [Siccirubricoccus deserti]
MAAASTTSPCHEERRPPGHRRPFAFVASARPGDARVIHVMMQRVGIAMRAPRRAVSCTMRSIAQEKARSELRFLLTRRMRVKIA